ncbi:MAG: universal stress protein [Rhizobiaceae bacterium]|nr:universal stress protein [Rhizobiaceae bacterium]
MFNNILIPVDLGDMSRATDNFKRAAELIDDGGKITLINVVEDIPTYVEFEMPENYAAKHMVTAQDHLQNMVKNEGIKAGFDVLRGKPGPAILDYAEENDIDLIIMASHKPELMDYLIGSTAARVVRHAKCSVMVIR